MTTSQSGHGRIWRKLTFLRCFATSSTQIRLVLVSIRSRRQPVCLNR